MDNQSEILNDKWKNYFNWAIIYPLVFFILIAVVIIGSIISRMSSFGDSVYGGLFNETMFSSFAGLFGTFFLGALILIVVTLAYLIWFIMASDNLFNLLGVNRLIGNVLNVVGLFVFGGLSFLILPIFFWVKMRDYWNNKGQKSSWRAVV